MGIDARRIDRVALIAAVGIAGGGTILHRLQPDGLAFLTVFPVWCWWLPGLILAAVGGRQASRRVRVVVAITWVFAIGLSSDTPLALLRPTHPLPRQTQAHAAQKLLRVVSFNTGSERYRTADEIGRWAPDIVLLQESYPRDDVAKLAQALFGDVGGWAWNNDTAILARGEVVAVEPESDAGRPFLLAAVRLDGWPEMHVVSLRLAPQPVRFDFWSADSWRTYANIRRKHRQELAMILHHLEAFPGDAPLVIAGDFNAPAGDAIFELLRPRYADAFAESGRGWGCTLPNRFPLLRIDQVWTAGQIEPLATCTAASQTSDHRLLIADLQLRSR